MARLEPKSSPIDAVSAIPQVRSREIPPKTEFHSPTEILKDKEAVRHDATGRTMIQRCSKALYVCFFGATLACSDNSSTPSTGSGPGASTTSSTTAAGPTTTTASSGAGGGSTTTTSSSAGGSAGTSSTSGSTAGTTGSSGGAGGSGGSATSGGGGVDGGAGKGGAGGASGSGGAGGGTPDAGTGTPYVFVSGYGGSIATFTFDPVQAKLTPKGTPTSSASASWLAWNTPT